MKQMLLSIFVAALGSACVWVSSTGLKPVSPPTPAVGEPKADSTTPLLAWEPDPTATSYDVVIWEVIQAPDAPRRGPEVYFRENISEPRHVVETPLQPGWLYYWSVRSRRGESVAEWSALHATVILPGVRLKLRNRDFLFRVPGRRVN